MVGKGKHTHKKTLCREGKTELPPLQYVLKPSVLEKVTFLGHR